MTRPTRPPTTVPLILMNWRSRPTCSSMRSAASRPSHFSIVWVITAVTSSPYRSTTKTAASAATPSSPRRREDGGAGGAPAQPPRQPQVRDEPLGEGGDLGQQPLTDGAGGVLEGG